MQIVILGMHRSGTSAVARLINMMGAYIGPENIMADPAYDNEKGFWERTDVKDLNDDVLRQLGSAWDDPVGLDLGALTETSREAFARHSRHIVHNMDAHRPWVMKDPRLCLLFPLWRPLLEVPVCVHVHRPPLEVAGSLRARNGYSITRGLALWEVYAVSALRGSAGLPRTLVDYHALMGDPVGTAAAIYEQLSAAGIEGLRLPSASEIRAFIDDRLFHQRSGPNTDETYLNIAQQRLSRAFEEGTALGWKDPLEVSAGALENLEVERQQRQAIDTLRGSLAEAKVEGDTLRGSLAEAKAEGDTLRGAYQELLDVLGRLAGDFRLLAGWLRQIEEMHEANVQSWRWRVGHGAMSVAERLLLRPRQPLATHHMTSLLRRYRDWYFERSVAFPVGTALSRDSNPKTDAGMAVATTRGMLEAVMEARRDKPDVIIFPIIDWHFRIQRPQHLARELARLGHRVFYFSTQPRAGEREPGYEILEKPEPGVFLCNLHHDGKPLSIYDRPMTEQSQHSLYASMRLMMEQCRVEYAAVIVDYPFWRPLAEILPGCPLIYDCMDNHAGFSTHTKAMTREEESLLQSADAVVTTSDWLSERIGALVPHTVIRNGAEVDAFRNAAAAASEEEGAQRPLVGYVGTIAEWFDLPIVITAARAYPQWDFVLVGATHGCDIRAAKDLPNIRFLGERPYSEVPGLVASFDVCVIPFKLTELILATNPVKVYEYLSAGKPVVAVDLPELRPLDHLVHLSVSEADFVDKLNTAMAERHDGELRAERQDWAAGQDWSSRARAFEAVIEARFPKVGVVVLTYNNLMFTQACLESLERFTGYPNWELIIVDNASSDGTPEYLKEYAKRNPRVRLILNESNLGFAAGNNCGIRAATGEHVVILNNDTYVTRGWLHGLIRHLQNDDTLGVVGPVTNNIGNEARIDIDYADMDAMAAAAEDHTFNHSRKLLPLDVAAFFCAAIRGDVLERVGLLDERFGIGFFEDDDYCRRVREATYTVAVAEDVFVHHHLSASFNEMDREKRKALFEKNRRLYEDKWGEWEPHRYRQSS